MLYFVGVGPGDPELITMKAARILRGADAIAIPDSGKDSMVWKIAGEWMEGKPVCRLPMPMKGKREDWEAAHRRAAEILLEWLEKYETIAYPVLGDPGIYASGSYLMGRIAPYHPCRVIPGVPAMCAAAAELGTALCEQGERLLVTDRIENDEQKFGGNMVVMKAEKNWERLEKLQAARIFLARNVGLPSQQLGTGMDGFGRDSYFTTAIIKAEAGEGPAR